MKRKESRSMLLGATLLCLTILFSGAIMSINASGVSVNNANKQKKAIPTKTIVKKVNTPLVIVRYELNHADEYGVYATYDIKNISGKPIRAYKTITFLYDKDGQPVYLNNDESDISTNEIKEICTDFTINPQETKNYFFHINNGKVNKIKILISEVQFMMRDDIWVNPEVSNFYKGKDKY